MASLRVLALDHEGRPLQFDTWLDDLQLYLLSDSRDSVSLFDHTSGAAPAPPATADIEDLVSHLRTSDARYRAALPADFLAKNPPPMDHFLALDPTALTVDLLKQHLLAAETSVVAVGAARGTPRPPFFEGCSPSPLAPSDASAAANVPDAADFGAASASAKRRSSKGKGGRSGGGGSGGGDGGSSGGGGGNRGGCSGGSGGGSGGFGGGGGGSGGSGGSGSGRSGGGQTGALHGGSRGGQRQQQLPRSETLSPQQLREWFFQRGASGSSGSCPYVIRKGDRAGLTCGKLHTQHRCFSRLDDAWRAEFGDEAERPRWAELLRIGVAIFDLDFDAILAAMYALSVRAGGVCYLFVPLDPGIEAAALGARDSVLPGTAPSEALHTFTLDSRASHCFFCESTTLNPLSAPVSVRQDDPSRGPALARSSTVLPYLAVLSSSLSGSTPLLVSPPVAPHPSVTPPRGSPLLAAVFPLRSKGQVVDVCLQLRERFRTDLRSLRLHSDRGGEFSSNLLREFCCGEGILQSFTLPDSPQQNGIAERRIGLVMGVARTSMIHAAAPHFLWPFAVRYAAHQFNLWPRVSLPETSPTLRWTGKVGDASVFRFWGSRAFVRDTFADKLSARAILCVFLGFAPNEPGWQFYHPTSCRVFPSQDIFFDESVPFYCLFPYCFPPPPPVPLFLAPGPPPVDPLPSQGPASSGVSQVDPLSGTVPVEVAPGAAFGGAASGGAEPGDAEPGGAGSQGAGSGGVEPEGAESEGAGSRGAEPGDAETAGVEPGGAEPEGVEPGGTASEGAESGGAEPRAQGAGVAARAGGSRGAATAGPGGARTGGTGAAGTVGVGGAGAGDPTKHGAAGAGGAGAVGAGAGGTGAGGAGAGGVGAVDLGAGGAGGIVRPRPYFVPLLQQVLGVLPSRDQLQQLLQPASPLLAPSPYTEQTCGLTERREPVSRPASPVRTARCVPHLRRPPVPGTHAMALRPSSVPLRVPLPPPPESSLPASTAASALVAELVDFAATCRLDYATALVVEYESANPTSVGGECALGTDVLEERKEDFECLAAAVPRFASMLLAPEGDPDAPDIPTPRSYAEAITGPYCSQWQTAMDAEMASWKSTGTYVHAVPLSRANIVDGMWIFRVKRSPGSPSAFKWSLWLPVYGLRQAPREWHETLRTTLVAMGLTPSIADPSLFLRTDTSLPPFHVLMYVNDLVSATADTEALTLVKSELQKRHTCTDLGELRSYLGLQITRDRARRTITLTQSHMVHQVLQRFGFQFSSPQPNPLSTGHSLSAPPSDKSVELSGPYLELMGCLIYVMTCTRPDLAYPLSHLARYVALGRHQKLHWDAVKRVLRYLCSTSGMGLVLGGRGPVVLTGHADASWVDDLAT
ncbi:unnamed protein product [Closterium sp. NIES-53]